MQKEFNFHKNYVGEEKYREAFFQFTPKVLYGADFRLWHRLGFWESSYVPYSFFKNGIMVSNASVCEMRIIFNGEEYDAVQLATVGTLSEYQKRGLSRKLIERIFDDYQFKASFFFLFGNESVADFYPKFGFRRVEESCFFWKNPNPFLVKKSSYDFRILNSDSKEDRNLFRRIASSSLPITKRFGALRYGFILSFYWIYAYTDHFYYFPKKDAILVIRREGNVLWIYDILCEVPFSVSEFLDDWNLEGLEEIRFGFGADRLDLPDREIGTFPLQSDSPLFVKDIPSALKSPFLFPMLART
ncbi:acetyltransferase (GNAT) domain protein [Leptospira weilii str. 2006001853]|uniref:Acetyltransferase (GNAT) domain protein n=2 Tax=Leptospira weilii TaxID=28184 RepID=A0A828Z619_9LEPT|nr:GNAT family N-acetyltransferase [Leptospira weilii]EKR65855.1 acetyltransferase (GNAT) domain protein [Leptospira weilii str. 2006001853]EMN43332.1 acetyltransferase (GNAT) domain protein [Leptospira weilii str. LNT 1234]MCL8268585.1 GNAT family N-acetyltransferase [Leptospira weilii]QDK22166.1 GNAT family N-acetyltransferase [Leptospira weilii]QDK26111.1 GNAT family N-acetyltransferase [Leptospira weilii]